jgi:pyruvate formate lyase activating enzyme
VRCLACNHYCLIAKDTTGICGVRKNEQEKLKSLVYGKAATFNVDPIEKKPLYHFYPGSRVFSFGTVGCNFRCSFCQNYYLACFPQESSELTIKASGADLAPEKIIAYCKQNQIKQIAFTYNEPAVFIEYCLDTAKLAKKNGLKTILVSNGYESQEALDELLPFLDAANIDLKSFREQFYQKTCGASLKPVLKTIKTLAKSSTWLEVTTLIIPKLNDSTAELTEIAEFLAKLSPDIPWHLSRFFPTHQLKSLPSTPLTTLYKAQKIANKQGLSYDYLGNIPEEQNTHCPSCGVLVIKRNHHQPINNLSSGKCPECATVIAGRYQSKN